MTPNQSAQPVYQAINAAIDGLTNAEAVAVLEEIAAHCAGMIEGMEEEDAE